MLGTLPFNQQDLQARANGALIPSSLMIQAGTAFWLNQSGRQCQLAVLARQDDPLLDGFHGERRPFAEGYALLLGPTDHHNARALREALPGLKPIPLGLTTSAGFGDRLGLATPGHVRALEHVLRESPGATIAPIFAQQSIREMGRTRRTPDNVLDDATWGALQAGWRGPMGADADHLKTFEDVDICAAAGYTFYTIDPGAYVDSEVDEAAPAAVETKVSALPWEALESTPADLRRQYVGRQVHLDNQPLALDEASILRAAAKYGKAVAHVAAMYRYIASKGVPFELEVSVDETETPTTHAEHVYVASELKRLGVQWVSLAPRYVGRFEKGVDYIGDLDALRQDLDGHAAIARALGPYKLSLHSGSDKFSVYPLIVEATRGVVHLKTAGTSYLEALRVIAQIDPPLFRDILQFAREHYTEDRATYHVSADVNRVPAPASLPDAQLPALLEDFDARQVLHVTFGSALAQFQTRLKAALSENEELYYETLDRHFYRHVKPFAVTR